MKVEKRKGFAVVEEGYYDAFIKSKKSVRSVQTAMGKCSREEFSFEILENTVVRQNVLVYYSPNGKNLLSRMFTAAFDQLPIEFDTDDLIGKEVVIEIKHNKVNGVIHVNVVDCLSLDEFEDVEEVEAEEDYYVDEFIDGPPNEEYY